MVKKKRVCGECWYFCREPDNHKGTCKESSPVVSQEEISRMGCSFGYWPVVDIGSIQCGNFVEKYIE